MATSGCVKGKQIVDSYLPEPARMVPDTEHKGKEDLQPHRFLPLDSIQAPESFRESLEMLTTLHRRYVSGGLYQGTKFKRKRSRQISGRNDGGWWGIGAWMPVPCVTSKSLPLFTHYRYALQIFTVSTHIIGKRAPFEVAILSRSYETMVEMSIVDWIIITEDLAAFFIIYDDIFIFEGTFQNSVNSIYCH